MAAQQRIIGRMLVTRVLLQNTRRDVGHPCIITEHKKRCWSPVYYYRTQQELKIQKEFKNPYIEEEQTKQWPKEKVQKYKQRSTKHTYKTEARVTRTPLKNGGELRCSGRVGSFCSTNDIRRVNLVTNLVISKQISGVFYSRTQSIN